ncbi:histidine phosphatase family protein [Rivihabitans pingtungensis]|uniref:histidine phosphatase family protein n=1 Tax=Rivihabitans pingtungensis TaxID=1054498 RepID=UPI002353DD93|nr:histidine phosphatase family protein [Rivihabitans pingtungensis]MCK6436853.1 phosphoglycerate mutase family protein [Rivihabitans pingtungensis]
MRSNHFFVLLRHAEAHKNVLNQHGGKGSALSSKGVQDAHGIGQFFRIQNLNVQTVIAIDKPQCHETAKIICQEIGCTQVEVAPLSTFSLGILDGLSENDVRQRYEVLARLLDQWRSGFAEAHELRAIPGATDPSWYFSQGEAFLTGVKPHLANHDVVLIATRSVLVVLTNILLGRNPSVGGGYREVPWPNGSYATFANGIDGEFQLIQERTNVPYFS